MSRNTEVLLQILEGSTDELLLYYILTIKTTFKRGERRERKMIGLSSQALTGCQSELWLWKLLQETSEYSLILKYFYIFQENVSCSSSAHPTVQVDVFLLLIRRGPGTQVIISNQSLYWKRCISPTPKLLRNDDNY